MISETVKFLKQLRHAMQNKQAKFSNIRKSAHYQPSKITQVRCRMYEC